MLEKLNFFFIKRWQQQRIFILTVYLKNFFYSQSDNQMWDNRMLEWVNLKLFQKCHKIWYIHMVAKHSDIKLTNK